MINLNYRIHNKNISTIKNFKAYESWHLIYYANQIYNLKNNITDKTINSLIKNKYLLIIFNY